MTVTSQVIQVKDLDPGQAVSYGRTFRADRPMRVAAAPVGYAHGYNRLLSNRGDALIQGHRARILGRVCMNLTLFDVTDIPEAGPGDEVVLMGRQGDETITADELAGIAGTISYEVFCRFGQADRVYREGES
jgi:alanine racemase